MIPKEVREKLNLQEGDRIMFIVDGRQVIVKPIKQTLLDLRGSTPVSGKQDFDAIRRQAIATGRNTAQNKI